MTSNLNFPFFQEFLDLIVIQSLLQVSKEICRFTCNLLGYGRKFPSQAFSQNVLIGFCRCSYRGFIRSCDHLFHVQFLFRLDQFKWRYQPRECMTLVFWRSPRIFCLDGWRLLLSMGTEGVRQTQDRIHLQWECSSVTGSSPKLNHSLHATDCLFNVLV